MNSDFKFKSNSGVVNIDEAQGIVECFVAGIGNKDSVGDIVISGAFAKSLTRRKPRVVWGHSWNDPIGKVLEMYEVPPNDSRLPAKMKAAGIGGLYARVQFNLQSDKGKEAFASVAFFGTDQEWSIGYKTIDAIFDPNLQANVLKEVELYEVSPVLHGANQLTGTISVKNHPISPAMPAMMPMTMDQMPRIIIVSSDSIGEPEKEREEDDEQELNLFAEGLAQPLTDEQKAKIQSELSERTGSKVEITHATEGSIVFKRTTTDGKVSMYRVGYHTPDDYNTFMFGKPEIYADGKKPQAETEIQSKPNPDTPVVLADGGASYRDNEQQMSSFLGSEENVNPWGKSLAMHLIQLPGYSMKDASQKLSSIFEYHKLDVVETNNGLLVTSQLSSDAMDALQVAVKGIGQTIGQSAGTLRSMSEGFNPHAIDGDNDGFAQDNTAFMRPYIPIGNLDIDLPDIGGKKRNSSELLDKPTLGSKIPDGDPNELSGAQRLSALAAGKLTPRTREDMMFLADRRPNNPGLAKYWDMNDSELTLAGQRLKSQRASVSSNERGPIDTELYKISHEFTRRQSYEQQFGKKFTPSKDGKKKPEKLNAAGRTAEQEELRMEKFRADANDDLIEEARERGELGSRSGQKPKKPNTAGRTAEQEELRNEKLRDGVNDDLITEAYERGELGSRSGQRSGNRKPRAQTAREKEKLRKREDRESARDERRLGSGAARPAPPPPPPPPPPPGDDDDKKKRRSGLASRGLKPVPYDFVDPSYDPTPKEEMRDFENYLDSQYGNDFMDYTQMSDEEVKQEVMRNYGMSRSEANAFVKKLRKDTDEYEDLQTAFYESVDDESRALGSRDSKMPDYQDQFDSVVEKWFDSLPDSKERVQEYLDEGFGKQNARETAIEKWMELEQSENPELFMDEIQNRIDDLNENRWDDYQSRNLGSRSKPLGSRMPNEGERIMQRGNRDFLSDEFSSSEYRQAMSGLDKVRKGDGKVTPEEDAAIQKLGKLYKARNNTTTNQRNAINDVLKNVNGYASGRQERRALGSRDSDAIDKAIKKPSKPAKIREYGAEEYPEFNTSRNNDPQETFDRPVSSDYKSHEDGSKFIGNTVTFSDGRRGVIVDGFGPEYEIEDNDEYGPSYLFDRVGSIDIAVTHDKDGNRLDEIQYEEAEFDQESDLAIASEEYPFGWFNDPELSEEFSDSSVRIDDNKVSLDEVEKLKRRPSKPLGSRGARKSTDEYKDLLDDLPDPTGPTGKKYTNTSDGALKVAEDRYALIHARREIAKEMAEANGVEWKKGISIYDVSEDDDDIDILEDLNTRINKLNDYVTEQDKEYRQIRNQEKKVYKADSELSDIKNSIDLALEGYETTERDIEEYSGDNAVDWFTTTPEENTKELADSLKGDLRELTIHEDENGNETLAREYSEDIAEAKTLIDKGTPEDLQKAIEVMQGAIRKQSDDYDTAARNYEAEGDELFDRGYRPVDLLDEDVDFADDTWEYDDDLDIKDDGGKYSIIPDELYGEEPTDSPFHSGKDSVDYYMGRRGGKPLGSRSQADSEGQKPPRRAVLMSMDPKNSKLAKQIDYDPQNGDLTVYRRDGKKETFKDVSYDRVRAAGVKDDPDTLINALQKEQNKPRSGSLGSRQTLQKIDVGDSQAIDDIHYDDIRKELHVGFTSPDGETRRYTYFGVSQDEADAIDASPSKGRAINDIKRNHDVEKIDSAALKRVTGTSDERMISPLTDSSGKYPGIGEPIYVSGSSALEDAFYDPRKRELVVKFKDGGSYVYEGVLPGEASALNSAPSKGRAINDIKKNHSVRKYEKEAGSSKLEWSETSGTSSETSGRSGLDYTIEKQADGTFAVEAGKSTYSYQDGPDFETVDTADGFETEDAAKTWAAQHDFAIIERESGYDKIDRDNERSRRNQPVDVGYSSAIESASWDERNNELSITYKGGKKYIYSDFTQDDLDKFEANPSKGRAANEVKKNHPVRKADSGPLGSGYEPSGGFRSQDPAYASDDDVMGDPYYDEIYEEVLLEVTSDEYLEDFLKINQDGYSPFTDEELTKLYKEEKWQEIAEGMREQIIEAFGARIENRAIDLTEQARQSRYDRSDRLGSRSGPLGSRGDLRSEPPLSPPDDEVSDDYMQDAVNEHVFSGEVDMDDLKKYNRYAKKKVSDEELQKLYDDYKSDDESVSDEAADTIEKTFYNEIVDDRYDIMRESYLSRFDYRDDDYDGRGTLGSRSGPLGSNSRMSVRDYKEMASYDDLTDSQQSDLYEKISEYLNDRGEWARVKNEMEDGGFDYDEFLSDNPEMHPHAEVTLTRNEEDEIRKLMMVRVRGQDSRDEVDSMVDHWIDQVQGNPDDMVDLLEKNKGNLRAAINEAYDIELERQLGARESRELGSGYTTRGGVYRQSREFEKGRAGIQNVKRERYASDEEYMEVLSALADAKNQNLGREIVPMDDGTGKMVPTEVFWGSRPNSEGVSAADDWAWDFAPKGEWMEIGVGKSSNVSRVWVKPNSDDGYFGNEAMVMFNNGQVYKYDDVIRPNLIKLLKAEDESGAEGSMGKSVRLITYQDGEKSKFTVVGELSDALAMVSDERGSRKLGSRSESLSRAVTPTMPDIDDMDEEDALDALEKSNEEMLDFIYEIEELARMSRGDDYYNKYFGGAVPYIEELSKDHDGGVEERSIALEQAIDRALIYSQVVGSLGDERESRKLGSRSSGNIEDVDVSESSALDSAYYHEPTGELVVSYANGRSYVYEDVSYEEFQNFDSSPSKGRAINEIKRTHGFRVASDEDRNDRIAGDRSEGDAMSRGALESNWKRIGSAEQQRYLSRETNSAISSGSGQSTDELLNAAQMRAMDDRNMADLEMQAESVGSGGRSIDVSSSQALNRVTYDKENELLSVEYRGRDGKGAGTVYEYQGVPEDVVASLESSDSRGAALRQIRDDYEFTTRDALPDSAYDKTSSKPLGSSSKKLTAEDIDDATVNTLNDWVTKKEIYDATYGEPSEEELDSYAQGFVDGGSYATDEDIDRFYEDHEFTDRDYADFINGLSDDERKKLDEDIRIERQDELDTAAYWERKRPNKPLGSSTKRERRLAALESALESRDEEAQKAILKEIFRGQTYTAPGNKQKWLGKEGNSYTPDTEITDEELADFIKHKFISDMTESIREGVDAEDISDEDSLSMDQESEGLPYINLYDRAIEILEEQNDGSFDTPSTVEEIADIVGSEELLFDALQREIVKRKNYSKPLGSSSSNDTPRFNREDMNKILDRVRQTQEFQDLEEVQNTLDGYMERSSGRTRASYPELDKEEVRVSKLLVDKRNEIIEEMLDAGEITDTSGKRKPLGSGGRMGPRPDDSSYARDLADQRNRDMAAGAYATNPIGRFAENTDGDKPWVSYEDLDADVRGEIEQSYFENNPGSPRPGARDWDSDYAQNDFEMNPGKYGYADEASFEKDFSADMARFESRRKRLGSGGSWPTPSGYEPDEFNMNEAMSQIGRGNIAAISGGRVVKRGNEMVLPVNRNQQVVVGYNGGSDTYYVRAEQIITSGKDKGKHKILAQWGEVYAENVGETAYNASLKPSMHSEENADFWKTSDLIPKNTLVDSQTGEKISNARPLGSRGSGRGAITGGNSRASIPNGDDSLYDEANGPGNSIRRRGSYSPPNQRLLARQDRAEAIELLAQKNITRMDILRKTNPKRFREMLKRENIDRRDWRELAYRDAVNAIDQLARYQERRASGNGVRRPPGGNLPKVDPSPRGDGLSPFANLKDGDIVTLDNGVFKVNGTEELRGALGSRAFNYGPETEAKTKAEAMKVLTDQLIKSIESAETGEWKMPWRVTTLPINPTTGRMYSGSNFLMLSVIGEARGYSSPQWAGYDQWAQKGGQVRKGAKGVPVFIPIPFKGKLDPVTNEEDGGGMSWKMIRVFNRDEIDGLPEDFANPPVLPEGTRIDNLEKTLSQIAPKITNGGSRAFYRPSDDSITVPEFKNFKSARDYYGTVAHEIMHWTGHKSRLNRDHMGQFGTPEYAYEELVAEIASAMFVGAHGLEPNIQENHGPYLKHWLKKLKDDPTALQRAIKDAQAAFDYVNGASPNLRGLMGSEDNGGLETSGKTVGKLSKPLGSMTSRPGMGLTANDVRDIDSDQLDSIMNHFGPQNVYNARPGEITQEDYEDIAKFLNNLTAEEVMGFSNRNRGTSKPLGSRSSSSVTDGKPKSARAKLEEVPVPPMPRQYDENRTSSDAYEDTEMEIGSYLESLSNAMKEIVGDDEFEKTFKPRVDSIIDDMRDERSQYAEPPDWALNRAWKLHKEMVSQSRMREPLGSSSSNGPLGSRMNLSQSEKNEIIAMARQMRKSTYAKSVVAQYDTNGGQLSDGQWAALNRMTLRGGGRNAMGSRSKPKKPRTPKGGWAPEDRQKFADRDILKSRKVPGKRRPGPSASEYGALGSSGTSAFVNGRTVDMEPRQDTKPLRIGLSDIVFGDDGKGKAWALADLARSSSEFRNITPQELMGRYGISERAALDMKKPGAKIRDPYLADELTNAFGFTPSEIWGPNNPTAYQNADGSLVDLSDLFEKPDKDFDPELDGSLPVVELPDADATLEGISSADEARKVRKRVGGSRSGKLSSGYDAQVLLDEVGYNGSRSRRALEQAFPEISEKRWRSIAGKDSTTGLTVNEVNSILKRLKSNKKGTDIFGESFESGTQTPVASIFRNPLIVANIEKRGGMNAVAEAYKKATGRSISRAQSYRLRDSKDSITSTELRVMLNELGISVEEFDARNKG